MQRTCRFVPVLLLAVASVRIGSALDKTKTLLQYAHRTWGLEEGLVQPTIYSIAQTGDGFIWLGTQDSLIRFDGMHFREWQSQGTTPFHGEVVHSLLANRHGKLWVGSMVNGLASIDTRNNRMQRWTAKEGLPSSSIWCVAEGRNGSIWACTDKGFAHLDAAGHIRTYTAEDGLPDPFVRNACVARDGTRWVAGGRFALARSVGERFVPYTGDGLQTGTTVTSLICPADGSVYAGTEDGVIHIKNGSQERIGAHGELLDGVVSSLTEAADGSIWVGTTDGISRLADGEISQYKTSDGLSHSLVLALAFDREGSLWAGTKDGLDQFTDTKITPFTTAQGLTSNSVGPVLQAPNGVLWVGTLDAGLNAFDGRSFRHLTTKDGLRSNRVFSLANGASPGELWIGTADGVEHLLHGQIDRQFRRQDALPGQGVQTLFLDATKRVWAGFNRGLASFDGRRFVPLPSSDPVQRRINEEEVLALSQTSDGSTLAALDSNHLSIQKGTRFTKQLLGGISHPVDCFYVDRRHHSVWMGTLGSGLLRWRNGVISHVYLRDGLYDNRIYSIVSDDRNNLWMASSKGIFRVGSEQLEHFANGDLAGVESLPFSTGQLRFECRSGVQPAATRTEDGRLWFATTSGLVVVDPNRLQTNMVPPPVQITATVVNGQRLDPVPALELRHGDRNLEIRYAGLSFVSPEKVTFRYRLTPYEKAWIDAGTRREAFYSNLAPGSYQFQVAAVNADGVGSRGSALLSFHVVPLFYQRIWFLPAVISCMIVLAVLAFRARMRRLQTGFELVLAERSRIARDLHDTLLQGLSGVTMQLQALWTAMTPSIEKQRLGGIIADASRCSTEARRSLWGLRTNQPTEFSLAEKLMQMARSRTERSDLQLLFEMEAPLVRLPIDTEQQVLRIVGEAITNACKHAGARQLTLSMDVQAAMLCLQVADDGCGFDVRECSSRAGHFGIDSMQERASALGGELQLESTGQGTTVTLQLPLRVSQGIEESVVTAVRPLH